MQNSTRVITVASSKGGVGKSTLCISLAGALAHRGDAVHIIDLDENRTVLRWYRQHDVALPRLSVSQVPPAELLAHLKEVSGHANGPGVVLIDVAGVYEKALLQAMARSHLVIVPAQPSEPDLHEAIKIIRDVADLNESFGGRIPYRLLLNMVEPLDPHYQRHTIAEVARLGLQRFETLMHKRAAYREAFLNGKAPHQCAEGRPSALKAVVEIDAIVAEIDALLGITHVTRAAA